MEKIKEFLGSINPVLGENALYVLIGLAIVVVLIILLIVVLCTKASKKKKATVAKAPITTSESKEEVANEPTVEEAVEEKVEDTPVEEEDSTPNEETQTEEPVEEVKTEEAPAEEPAPVVEEKKPAKKAPAKKAAPKKVEKEEAPAPTPEVAPIVEEPAKEEKKPVKKAPTKKASPKKVEEAPAPEEAQVAPEEQDEKKGVQGKYILVKEGPNWRYKLKASNGEVIIVSEPYKTEKAVRTGIETLKKNLDLSSVDVIEDKHGLFSFRIMTKQGRCLATSANYKTKQRAISASESYKRWATSDIVVIDEEAKQDTQEVEKVEFEVEEENTGTFVIKTEGDGFVYQLIAANGRVIATSLIYRSKDSCLEACETFRACVYKGDFYVTKDKNAKFQFKLYNKQNRLVLAGEVYDDKSRVISVIEAIKRLAKLAKLVDNTVE